MADPRKLSTEELLRLCLENRDEVLWWEFVRRFQPLIAGVIFKRLSRCPRWIDRADVDDLVSDVFIKICKDDFKALRNFEFRHENALHGFLKVMAAHVVEDYIRKKKSDKEGGGQEPGNIDDLPQPPSDHSNSVHSIFNNLRMNEIEDCLQQLAGEPNFGRDYKIFWLYFRDGFTAHDISQLPNIGFKNEKGVESALLRMIKWLRSCLDF